VLLEVPNRRLAVDVDAASLVSPRTLPLETSSEGIVLREPVPRLSAVFWMLRRLEVVAVAFEATLAPLFKLAGRLLAVRADFTAPILLTAVGMLWTLQGLALLSVVGVVGEAVMDVAVVVRWCSLGWNTKWAVSFRGRCDTLRLGLPAVGTAPVVVMAVPTAISWALLLRLAVVDNTAGVVVFVAARRLT
jgi:hypothetical protein